METNNKEIYEAPAMRVVGVKTEGIICTSMDPESASMDQYEPIPF